MLKSLRFLLLFTLGLGLCATTALAEAPTDPSGVWLDEDGQARIRVEHCERPADRICGYLVWSKDPAGATAKDDKNPDDSKKSRPILGVQLILGLAAEDEVFAGQIYNADNGKTYDVKLQREDDDHLKVKGCVLKFLCGSQTWTRVSDVLPGQLVGAVDTQDGPRADAEWAQAPAPGGHKKKHAPKVGAAQ